MNIHKIHYKQGLFWAFLLFISYSFLAPVAGSSGFDIPHLDKIVHFVIFFVLSALANMAYRLTTMHHLLWLGSYGILIEVLQAQTGYRSGDVFDWIADMLGTGLLLLTSHYYQQHKLKSNAPK